LSPFFIDVSTSTTVANHGGTVIRVIDIICINVFIKPTTLLFLC
jgi:hypothetical protein